MKEDILREAVRTAIREIAREKPKSKEDRLTFAPEDKEHLSSNKENLNKELMRRWGLGNKK